MTPPSILKKFVLTPALIGSATFLVLVSPLFVVRSLPIQISVENEPLVSGEVKDVAAPYLGVATLLSVAASGGFVAFRGWQKSARQVARQSQQISVLEQEIQTKETELFELQSTERKLMAEGLDGFLE